MGGEGRGGEALAVEPSHFSTGSDATAPNTTNCNSVVKSYMYILNNCVVDLYYMYISYLYVGLLD